MCRPYFKMANLLLIVMLTSKIENEVALYVDIDVIITEASNDREYLLMKNIETYSPVWVIRYE